MTLTEEMRVGGEGGEEKKKGLLKKRMRQMGRGRALWCVSISECVRTGKAALFIKVSHPSAPYSSAPTDCK